MSAAVDSNSSGAYVPRVSTQTESVANPIDCAIEGIGSQELLAEKLGVSQSLVSQMRKGVTACQTRHWPGIIEASKGLVTPEQLMAFELERQRAREVA